MTPDTIIYEQEAGPLIVEWSELVGVDPPTVVWARWTPGYLARYEGYSEGLGIIFIHQDEGEGTTALTMAHELAHHIQFVRYAQHEGEDDGDHGPTFDIAMILVASALWPDTWWEAVASANC